MLFLEHKHLLRQPYTVDPFPPADYVVPFGARRRRAAPATTSRSSRGARRSRRSLQARRRSVGRADGIEVEVDRPAHDRARGTTSIGGRQSWPRTGRLLVVHEDMLTAGFGAEVAAWAGEHCFADLDAPVRRVGAARHATSPTSRRLEQAILPAGRRHPGRPGRPGHLLTDGADRRLVHRPARRRGSRWPELRPIGGAT